MQLDAGIRTLVYLLGNTFADYRELELVRLNRALYFGVLQTGLNHLAFIGLEDKPFFLEIIDISFIHSLAIDEAELEKNERRESQNGYTRHP